MGSVRNEKRSESECVWGWRQWFACDSEPTLATRRNLSLGLSVRKRQNKVCLVKKLPVEGVYVWSHENVQTKVAERSRNSQILASHLGWSNTLMKLRLYWFAPGCVQNERLFQETFMIRSRASSSDVADDAQSKPEHHLNQNFQLLGQKAAQNDIADDISANRKLERQLEMWANRKR